MTYFRTACWLFIQASLGLNCCRWSNLFFIIVHFLKMGVSFFFNHLPTLRKTLCQEWLTEQRDCVYRRSTTVCSIELIKKRNKNKQKKKWTLGWRDSIWLCSRETSQPNVQTSMQSSIIHIKQDKHTHIRLRSHRHAATSTHPLQLQSRLTRLLPTLCWWCSPVCTIICVCMSAHGENARPVVYAFVCVCVLLCVTVRICLRWAF